MTINGNEMTIQRGETFTIDRLIVNRDGSPYIVSSEYANPYILLTVSSTKYNQENRYLANWWLNLDEMYDGKNIVKVPRFFSTRFKEITSKNNLIEYYEDEPYEYLYYIKNTGTYEYFSSNGETTDAHTWHEYNLRLIHHFMHNITKDWVEQSYVYSIRLVAGKDMTSYLKELYKTVFEVDAPDYKSNEELYLDIKAKDEKFVEDLNYTRPLVNFDVVQDIVLPTKLTVLSDLNGGLK